MIEVEHRPPQHFLRKKTEIRDDVGVHVVKSTIGSVSRAEPEGLLLLVWIF